VAQISGLDFASFVEHRKSRGSAPGRDVESPHAYAYVADRNTRSAFDAAPPVELVVAAAVRVFEHVERARLLGSAVRVSERQFPRVHALARRCAETLGIPQPTLYVVNSPVLNGATYGTRDSAFIMINSGLVDHFSDEELLSVIGHECGHVHNDHVVYLTTLHMLSNVAGALLRYASLPASLALRAWSRRAEITCDRAGALCAGDAVAAERALTKLALGSQKLYAELDVDAFLEQFAELQQNAGRYTELLSTHPFLPKRVLALRVFADSELYRRRTGRGDGGLGMTEVDERVHDYVKVVG
jgi:Zn-dependent protease with chaperone function